MGYGFLGAVSGLGKGATRYGTAVMEDAFEERRQERIKKIQEEMEATRHQYALERQDQQNVFTNERDETLHGFQVDRDEAGFANTDKRDAASRAHDINKLETKHGHDLALESHKQQTDPAKMPPGTPGAKVDSQVFTNLRADYAHQIDPGDMHMAAAASEGDEAFMRYIEQTGQLGTLYEFAAKPPYSIDLRTGTYLDPNTLPQPSQGVGLLGGGGFAGDGDSSGPAADAASGGPQPGGPGPGGPPPPSAATGLLSPAGPQRSPGHGGGGRDPMAGAQPREPGPSFAERLRQNSPVPSVRDSAPGPQEPQETQQPPAGGKTQAERIIDSIPDPQAKQEAMALLDEALEAVTQRPDRRAEIEAMLASELRELGASM